MTEIRQTEGLCHMWYRCKECKKKERLWNSRPRVTPFMIGCFECDGTMQHIDWHLDEYAPNYQPQKGDRIFVDWSKEAEEKMRREQIDQHWDSDKYAMKDMTDLWKTKEEALKYFLNEWKFGQPTVETI